MKNGGYIIIDDAYGNDGANTDYLTKDAWLILLDKVGVRFVNEIIPEKDEIEKINENQLALIVKRAEELKQKHPEKLNLFDSYIKSQQDECYDLENNICGTTMLLQKINDITCMI